MDWHLPENGEDHGGLTSANLSEDANFLTSLKFAVNVIKDVSTIVVISLLCSILSVGVPRSTHVAELENDIVIIWQIFSLVFTRLIKQRPSDYLLNPLVVHLEGIETLNGVVGVADAEVEDVAEQGEGREHFAEVELILIHKKEDHGRDDHTSVEVDRTADVLDVTVDREGLDLLCASFSDPSTVELLEQAALDGLDASNDLCNELNASVSDVHVL